MIKLLKWQAELKRLKQKKGGFLGALIFSCLLEKKLVSPKSPTYLELYWPPLRVLTVSRRKQIDHIIIIISYHRIKKL